jgi:tRNA dihydrouridine synthase A
MMDWTDRHCRYLHRLITRHTLLYTEMVTTGALIHGDQGRHLDYNAEEHPVALQLGGSEPDDLAQCARLAERWGYDEVNLNCGCPSERVQRGAFGACLMNEPQLVADCVKAMRDATALPVTVKHRIGIDKIESYDFVRDFVGTVAAAGCEASSSCMRAMPGCRACRRRKTARSRRCATSSWPSSSATSRSSRSRSTAASRRPSRSPSSWRWWTA